MGLLKLILGFDHKDYERLRGEVEELRGRLKRLELENQDLRELVVKLGGLVEAYKGELGETRKAYAELAVEFGDLRGRLESLEATVAGFVSAGSQGDEEADSEELEEGSLIGAGEVIEGSDEDVRLVLEVVKSGVYGPSEIIARTGLSKGRVYAALRRLGDEGLIERKREGRRVYYLPVGQVEA